MVGFTVQNDTTPPRGERVATYVEGYLREHAGLSVGELAFRLRADKRDLRRLLNDRSCGWRLEDALAAYFGPVFVDAVFAPVCGSGPSIREKQLEREIAEMAAKRERLERDRADDRAGRVVSGGVLRVVGDKVSREGL